MTLEAMQDRIQYRGTWAGKKRMTDKTGGTGTPQADDSQSKTKEGPGFFGTLTQAAGGKRTDAMGDPRAAMSEMEVDTRSLREKMQDLIAKLNEKVRKGETSPSFQIGAQSFTIEEWDRLIERIDAAQEEAREQQRARRGERLKEEAQEGVAKADFMDNRYAEKGVIRKDDDTLTIEEQLERILLDMDDPDERAQAAKNADENARDGENADDAHPPVLGG